jgi:hypothetical protein
MGRPYEHQSQRYGMQPGATRRPCADAVLTTLSRKGSPCLTSAHVRWSLPAVDEREAKPTPTISLKLECMNSLNQIGISCQRGGVFPFFRSGFEQSPV